jgi:hypothetical protein
MHLKRFLSFMLILVELSLSAQTQSWQWVKAGGSSSDNGQVLQPPECKIAGCDAYGNVYAIGEVTGPNMRFDTFSSAGAYSCGYNNIGLSYLMFSYDCAGNMRWAKQIGDEEGDFSVYGAVTDPLGNTYFAGQFYFGYIGNGLPLYLGDTTLPPTSEHLCQYYLCMVKYDSLGRLVWFKNFQNDSVWGDANNAPYGLRLGSSGNIWMMCNLDSNYAISPNLHTTKMGKYNVEIEPDSGNILGGYYVEQTVVDGDAYSYDTYYDMDANENLYSCGTIYEFTGDTLVLANQKYAPSNQLGNLAYIYSLDRQGNIRFVITNSNYNSDAGFTSCKFNHLTNNLVTGWFLDSGIVFQSDTFNFNTNRVNSTSTVGLFAIDTIGNIAWAKYITQTSNPGAFTFAWVPTASYIDNTINDGLIIYNNADTLFNNSSSSSTTFTKVLNRIDGNGNITANYMAYEGALGNLSGSNHIKYGATDWRGNVYLGGTVTNFFATPADSVVNTDANSGNFFIAKLGISDCNCPTPGVQFTQTVVGDTVFFYGSSINHSDSIRWRLGDGGISSSDTFFHVYTNHDSTYSVTAIAYSGCGVDSITKLISVTSVGIKTIKSNETNLYPNPATNSVNIDISGAATIGLVYANGSSVWSNPIQVSQQGTYVFDMSKYSCAMYYFIVRYTNGKTDVMQVVKE